MSGAQHWRRAAAIDRTVRMVLAAVRTDANLTQRALAARFGLAPSYIGKIEIGTRRTTVRDFVLIAQALEVNPAELLAQITVVVMTPRFVVAHELCDRNCLL